MTKRRRSTHIWTLLALIGLAILFVWPSFVQAVPLTAGQQVQASWNLVNDLASYDYQTDLTQTIHPTNKLVNLGRQSHQEHIKISGETDRLNEQFYMKFEGKQDLEMKIEDGQSYGRAVGSEQWELLEGEEQIASEMFASNGDPLGFLAAADNVRIDNQSADEQDGLDEFLNPAYGQVHTVYSFEVNGPRYAEHMRQQLTEQLRARGELPAGVTVGLADVYVEMTGHGQLWISEDGLPLRIETYLEFPPTQDEAREWVSAEFTTNFSNLQKAETLNEQLIFGVQRIYKQPSDVFQVTYDLLPKPSPDFIFLLGLSLLLGGVVALMVTYSYSRKVYTAFSLSVIFAMVFSPLMRGHQVNAYYEQQSTRQMAHQQEQAVQAEQEAAQAELTGENFNPRLDPLAESATDDTSAISVEAAQSAVTASAADSSDDDDTLYCDETDDTTVDDDGDGLNDNVECYELGTWAISADTDGDLISDKVEVEGVTAENDSSNTRWYLNPLHPDSNGDGLVDLLECPALETADSDGNVINNNTPTSTACPDTDSDGVPDLFDFDNDGDGVPDSVDRSPFYNGLGTVQSEVNYSLSGYNTDKSIVVDFELRPTEADHLYQSYNVLAWENGDTEGQITRVKGDTWVDYWDGQDQTLNRKGQNGNMMLIPMLEISLPDSASSGLPVLDSYNGTIANTNNISLTEWLDTDMLDEYSIEVNKDEESGELYVYIPLIQLQDSNGSTAVAWAAQMYYRPENASWGTNHTVKMVWLINALVDTCNTTGMGDDNEYDEWCSADNPDNWDTEARIIHTYYEEFYLTGFSVREDNGFQSALITQNDALTKDYADDLWALSYGLSSTFSEGTQLSDGSRFDIDQIEARFDPDGSASDATWDLDPSNFSVATYSYSDQVTGLDNLIKSDLPDVLGNYSANTDDIVTVLIAREQQYRSTNLDSSDVGVSTSGSVTSLAVDLNGVVTETYATLSWNPYQYDGSSWDGYDYETYITDDLGDKLANAFDDNTELNNWLDDVGIESNDLSTVSEGAIGIARNYYWAMALGDTQLVETSNGIVNDEIVNDDELALAPYQGVLTIARIELERNRLFFGFVEEVLLDEAIELLEAWGDLDQLLEEDFTDLWHVKFGGSAVADFAKWYAKDRYKKTSGFKAYLKQSGTYTIAGTKLKPSKVTGKASAVAGLAYGISFVTKGDVSTAFLITSASFATISSTTGFLKYAKFASNFKKAAQGSDLATAIKGSTKIAAKAGLGVDVAVATIVFTATVLGNNISVDSLAFTAALATFIAQVIVAIILFAIALIPGGALVVAVLELIDAVILIICEAVRASGEETSEAVDTWVCNGITGALTELVNYLIYDQTTFVKLDKKDRLNLALTEMALVDEQAGFAVGNSLQVSGMITTSLYFNEPKSLGWRYWSQFSDDNLKKSEFGYELQQSKTDPSLSRPDWEDTSNNEATPFNIPDDKQAEATFDLVSEALPFTKAGMNVKFDELYFSERFKLKAQECWSVVVGTVCYLRDYKDGYHNDEGENFVFDVLPATFDGFVTFASTDSGKRLAWDEGFPILNDADGDGLPREYDPDDGDPDYDNDGLNDYWENENGYDPSDEDADGDCLTDYWEVFYNSDPNLADTDGDGLVDGLEVYHPAYINPYSNSGNLVQCEHNIDENGNYSTETWIGGWDIVYDYNGTTPQTTRINADPLYSDADGDNIFDRYEYVYGYNPNVPDTLNVLSMQAELESTVVAATTTNDTVPTLPFTATIKNELDNRYASGLLEGEHPIDTVQLSTVLDTLAPQESVTLNDSLNIDIDSTQATTVTLRAGAIIQEASAIVGDPLEENLITWLELNEAAGSTTFADSSLNGHDMSCPNPDTCPTANGSYLQFDDSDGTYDGIGHGGFGYDVEAITLSFWVHPLVFPANNNPFFSLDVGYLQTRLHLKPGNVLADIGLNHEISLGSAIPTDRWSHMAFTIDSDGTAAFYVNSKLAGTVTGVEIKNEDVDEAGVGFAMGSHNVGQAAFEGYIDDIRLYNKALTTEEVQNLVSVPLVDINMNNVSSYQNASGTGTVSTDGNQPTIASNGAVFNQVDYLTVSGSDALELADNQFTFSMWLKPEERDYPFDPDAVNAFTFKDTAYDWQGVFGNEQIGTDSSNVYSSYTNNYPSLYVNEEGGIRLRFDTENEGICTYQVDEDVLTYDSWQYLTISYDGDGLTTYINGYEDHRSNDGTFSCHDDNPVLETGSSFYIGRPNTTGYLYFNTIDILDIYGTGNAFHVVYDGNSIWAKLINTSSIGSHDIKHGDDITNNGEGSFKVADGINGQNILGVATFDYFDLTEHSTSNKNNFADGGDEADVYWSISNDYFQGELDDFKVYNYAMSENQVATLYGTNYLALDLAFNEPPGTDVFSDDSGNDLEAVCDSTNGTCPDSGLAGRDNQALRFDGSDGEYLQVPSPGFDESLADGFTAGLWFKLTGDITHHQILVRQANGTSTGRTWLQVDSNKNLRTFITGSAKTLTSVQLALDTWYYGAISYNGSQAHLSLYDGTTTYSMEISSATADLSDGDLYLGANESLDSDRFLTGWLDELTILRSSLEDDIESLALQAPILNLHLDESVETTTFTDDTPYANDPTCTDCPKTGVAGRIREATVFQGDETLRLDNMSGDEWALGNYTISAWVKPDEITGETQDILYKLNSDGSYSFRFHLRAESLSPRLRVDAGCTSIERVTGADGLPEDQWSHMVATYNGTDMVLYVNGAEVDTNTDVSGCSSISNTDIVIGENFVGNLDEVAIYGRAMSATEVNDLFLYQSAWYDIAEEFAVQVDADGPVFNSFADGEYFSIETDEMLGIGVSDSPAGVASLRYRVDNGSWETIDLSSQSSGGYVFEFDPTNGDGTYNLDFKAFDALGNQSTYSSQIHVDTTAGTATLTDPGPVQAPTNGTVTLNGTVSDSGVGLEDIRVWVSLYDGLGNSVSGRTLATVDETNGTWTVDYPFGNPPYSTYTVKLTVEDRLGNNSGMVEAGTITLDGYGPVGDILLDTDVLTDTTAISGVVSDPLYPTNNRVVHFHFEENAGATEFFDNSGNLFHASCTTCPTAGVAGQFGRAVQFNSIGNLIVASDELTTTLDADNSDQTFMGWISHNGSGTPDQIVNNSNGPVGWALRLNTSGKPIVNVADETNSWTLRGDALEANRWYHLAGQIDRSDNEIRLYVDGQLVATEAAEVGNLDGGDGLLIIGSNVTGGSNFDGLLDEVVVYNTALSDETIYQIANPTGATVAEAELRYRHASGSVWPGLTPDDVAFYLPLDTDNPSDFSLNAHEVSCDDHCPTFEQVGQHGLAATFDGSDDYLTATHILDPSTTEFSAATWFKVNDVANTHIILSQRDGTGLGRTWLRSDDSGVLALRLGSAALYGTTSLNISQWYHAAVTYDGTTLSLYLDGALENSFPTAIEASDGDFVIGANKNLGNQFDGKLDELVIFDRALSVDEIGLLATNPWQDVTLDSNSAFTTWSATVPTDLADGPYQLDLLATDSLSNSSVMRGLWNGEIDTQAPKLTFTVSEVSTDTYDVTCGATDFNLDETSWSCPIGSTPTMTYTNQHIDYDWYTTLLTDTSQLVELVESGTITNTTDFTACDSYGHCATASPASSRSARNTQSSISRIVAPSTRVFTSLQAIEVGGLVSSNDGLQSLSVTANGQVIHSQTWSGNPTSANWTTNWTPANEGTYDLIATLTTTTGETVSGTATLYVDLTDPTVSITTSQFNQANVRGNRLLVNGTVNDATNIARLEAKVDDGPWRLVPLTDGTAYTATVAVNGRLTADSYNVTVRATDHAGRTASSSQTIPFDLSPPTGLELNVQAEGQPYRPGDTIVASSPAVVVNWNTSDAVSHGVEWLNNGTIVASETLAGSASQHSYQATSGQKLTVRVTATDASGNTASREYGPIFVDDAQTPILTDLTGFQNLSGLTSQPYEGWLTNGCTLLGIDHRRAQATSEAGTFNRPQQLHSSWNNDGLRLAWQGADWRTQGELFIYLDTVEESGATTAYNPFDSSASVTVLLPTDMSNNSFTADYLVWVREVPITETVTVEDEEGSTETITQTVQQGAVLLQWDADGAQWQEVDGEFGYRLDTQRPSPLTDIYLPFNLLGISDPAAQSLGLVAFASEEEQLKLWTTLPAANNLNSETVVNRAVTSEVESFTLINHYQWDQLGEGSCPNQDGAGGLALYNGADLSVSLISDPGGVSYNLFEDQVIFAHRKLFASAADWTALDNRACANWRADPDRPANAPPPPACRKLKSDTSSAMHARRDLRRLMNTDTDYLSDGDEVNLTVTISNNGTQTAQRVRGQLTTPGQLRFAEGDLVNTPGGKQIDRLMLDVGNLPAGESRTFNIPAQVDMSFNADNNKGWAHVKLLVFDETGSRRQPNHQLHLDHPLDNEGPSYVELTDSTNLVKPGAATFRGVVIDDSPVPTVLVEVGGSQTTCSDSSPADTNWSCELTIPDGADGQSLTTRVKAIDVHGQESEWFDGPTLTLDMSAPAVTATDVLTGTLGDGLIGPNEALLVGTLSDNRFAHKVVVCEGESCGEANVLLDSTTVPTTSYVYRDEPDESLIVGSDHTCPDKLVRTFDVSDSFTIADLDVGLLMGHDNRNDAVAWLTSPAGTRKELVSRGANVSNLNVLLDDAASLSIYVDDDQSDHMISPPFFSNVRRPHKGQLADFRGENAQGTWLLELCDHYDDEDDGLYYRSELRFTAQAVYTGTVGTWQHTLNLPANQEAITKTYSVYGVDQAGNESEPITFSVNIDTKSPELTVDTTTPLFSPTRSQTSFTGPITLAGTVNDANLNVMRLTARTPNGQFIRDRIPVSGQTWQYSDETTFNRAGLYCIWVEAEDEADNQQTSAAYALQVTFGQVASQIDSPLTSQELTIGQSENNGQYRLFLPLIGVSHNNDAQSVYRYFVDPAVCR